MSDLKEKLSDVVLGLKQQRDELSIQIHLAGMEAKDEWDKLTRKFDQLNDQFQPVKDAVGETSEDVLASMQLLAEEIRDGFVRIGKAIVKKQ